MDNQHKLIKGYRDLTQDEIHQMNSVKHVGQLCGEMIAALNLLDQSDKRWVSIAKTHLQEGIMAAVRAVAKPESF